MALDGIVDSIFKDKDGEVCITFRGINAGVKLSGQKLWYYSSGMSWDELYDTRIAIEKDEELDILSEDIQTYSRKHPVQSNKIRVKAKVKDSKVFARKYFKRKKLKNQQGQLETKKNGEPRTKKVYKFKDNFSIQSGDIARVGEIIRIPNDLESKLKQAGKSDEFSFAEHSSQFETRGFTSWDQVLKQGICFLDTEQPHFKHPEKKVTSHAAFMFYKVIDGQETIEGEYHTLRQIPPETKDNFEVFIHETPQDMGRAIEKSIIEKNPWVLSGANIFHDIRELTNDFEFQVGGEGSRRKYKITSPQDFPKGIHMHRRLIMDFYREAKRAISFLGNQKLKTFTSFALEESQKKKDLSYEQMEIFEDLIINNPRENQDKAQAIKDYQIQDVVVLKLLTDIGFGENLSFLGNWSGFGIGAMQNQSWMSQYWNKRLLENTGIDTNSDFPKIKRKKETVPEEKIEYWERQRDKENAKNSIKKNLEKRVKEIFGQNSPGEYVKPYAYYLPYIDELSQIIAFSNPKLEELIEYKNNIHSDNQLHEILRKKHLEGIAEELISPIIRDYNIYQKYADKLTKAIQKRQLDKEKIRETLRYTYQNLGEFQRYHIKKNHNLEPGMELGAGLEEYKRFLPELNETNSPEEKQNFLEMLRLYQNISDIYFIAKNSYGIRLEKVGEKLRNLFSDYQSVPILAAYQNIIFSRNQIKDEKSLYLGRPDKITVSKSRVQIDWKSTTKGSKIKTKQKDANQLELI